MKQTGISILNKTVRTISCSLMALSLAAGVLPAINTYAMNYSYKLENPDNDPDVSPATTDNADDTSGQSDGKNTGNDTVGNGENSNTPENPTENDPKDPSQNPPEAPESDNWLTLKAIVEEGKDKPEIFAIRECPIDGKVHGTNVTPSIEVEFEINDETLKGQEVTFKAYFNEDEIGNAKGSDDSAVKIPLKAKNFEGQHNKDVNIRVEASVEDKKQEIDIPVKVYTKPIIKAKADKVVMSASADSKGYYLGHNIVGQNAASPFEILGIDAFLSSDEKKPHQFLTYGGKVNDKGDFESLYDVKIIDSSVAKHNNDGYLYPKKPGTTTVEVSLNGMTASCEIEFVDTVILNLSTADDGKVNLNNIKDCPVCHESHVTAVYHYNVPNTLDASKVIINTVNGSPYSVVQDQSSQTLIITAHSAKKVDQAPIEFVVSYGNDVLNMPFYEVTVKDVTLDAPKLKANGEKFIGTPTYDLETGKYKGIPIVGNTEDALFSYVQNDEFDRLVAMTGHTKLAEGIVNYKDGTTGLSYTASVKPATDAEIKDGMLMAKKAGVYEVTVKALDVESTVSVNLQDITSSIASTAKNAKISADLSGSSSTSDLLKKLSDGKDLQLVVKSVELNLTDTEKSALQKQIGTTEKIVGQLSIHVEDEDGKEIPLSAKDLEKFDPTPVFKIEFKTDKDTVIQTLEFTNRNSAKLYYLDDNNKLTAMNSKLDNGKLTVEMNHMSNYIVTESARISGNGTLSSGNRNSVSTAANTMVWAFVALFAFAAAALVFIGKVYNRDKN